MKRSQGLLKFLEEYQNHNELVFKKWTRLLKQASRRFETGGSLIPGFDPSSIRERGLC
jgi:hypothetical protein